MGKQHFDLSPLSGRTLEGFGAPECAHVLAFSLEQVARDDPLFAFGAAWFECTGAAVLGTRQIGYSAVLAHQAGTFELFASGTNKDIGLRVKGEVGAGEKAICLVLAVKQRDVRLDLMPHQPPAHQTRSVGGIGGQPLRFETEAILGPLEHGLG